MNLSEMRDKKWLRVTTIVVAALLVLFGLWAVLDASGSAPSWVPAFPGTSTSSTTQDSDSVGPDGTVDMAVATATPAANGTNGASTDDGAEPGSQPSAGTPGDSGDDNGGTTPNAPSMTLMILFWNDTQAKDPKGFEVAVGTAKWVPSDPAVAKLTGEIKGLVIGKKLQLEVYPDGRSGKKILVPIELTKDMRSGSEADAVHVEVKDDTVRVLGTPVENFDVTVER